MELPLVSRVRVGWNHDRSQHTLAPTRSQWDRLPPVEIRWQPPGVTVTIACDHPSKEIVL
jgi:hypothetical protein